MIFPDLVLGKSDTRRTWTSFERFRAFVGQISLFNAPEWYCAITSDARNRNTFLGAAKGPIVFLTWRTSSLRSAASSVPAKSKSGFMVT